MSYPEAARALLRDTLLDAAGALLDERPWAKIPMGDVARRAGVSRQTLYNEFGGRQEFAQAYILREADRFLGTVEQAITAHADDPREAVASAFDLFLSVAAENRLIRAIATGDGSDGLLALVTVQGGTLLATATERLAAFIVATWPGLPMGDARLVAESLVRLAISHAALPSGPAAMTAASVAEVLGPYLDQLFTRIRATARAA